MNHDSKVIAPEGAADAAVRAAEAMKLQVLDHDWGSANAEHQLGAVALVNETIIAVVDVRFAAREELGEFVMGVSDERLRVTADAGRAWLASQPILTEHLWVVLVTETPDGLRVVTGNVVPGNIASANAAPAEVG